MVFGEVTKSVVASHPHAEVADCLRVVERKPLYSPFRPCSRMRSESAWKVKRKRFWDLASSINAVFNRSVGVTATTLSTQPAAMPATIPRHGESFPVDGLERATLIESKVRKRTEASNAVLCILS